MYPCSDDFHRAVAGDNPQKALLIFQDLVFTNDDISVENGIEFSDYFNLEEDLSIGQTLSNEIRFSLFNDDRLLNDYEFGDFLATIGVLVSEKDYSQRGIAQLTVGNDEYVTDSKTPFIRKNGTALAFQPDSQIRSMLAYDGKLYCFGEGEGDCVVYRLSDGAVTNTPVNGFMTRKARKLWDGKGMYYHTRESGGILIHELQIWQFGVLQTYEFCPLGYFQADRPKAPDKIQIDMTCNDRMIRFDEDWDAGTAVNISFPCTVMELFSAVCESVGLIAVTDNTLPNAGAIIGTRPEAFDTATKRDVLKWIAEATGSNARMNRDGFVVLDWIRTTGQIYRANGYAEFEPHWYQTKRVSKLYNRSSSDGSDRTVGEGDEGYLILDNPLLKGVS